MGVNTNLSRFRALIAIAAGAALTLASCGGDDDAADTTPPVEEPAEATAGEPGDEAPPMAPAALTLTDQTGDGARVLIDGVELPSAGFIAVHGDGGGSPGPVIGVSDLLSAGSSSDVVVVLDEPLTASGTVFPMVHIDTDGNGVYEFGAIEGVDGPGLTASGDVAVGPLAVTIDGDDTGDDTATNGANAAGPTITIADFSFSGVTEVAVGTTVVVTNTDGTPHTWTAEDGTFDSGSLGPDETFEFTFDEAGTFSYFCNFHPSMTGTIVVTG